MLLCEDLRRGHERGLTAALHGEEHRRERDKCFSAADIALKHPVHGVRRGKIGANLRDRAVLSPGQCERHSRAPLAIKHTGPAVRSAPIERAVVHARRRSIRSLR